MNSLIRLARCLAACLCLLALTSAAQTISPLPQEANYGTGAFPNSTKFRLVGDKNADTDAVLALRDVGLASKDKRAVRLVIGEAGDKAVKQYLKLIPETEQGYYLKVSPTEVVIAGRDGEGTFYGAQTFLQLMGENEVPECEIRDWPSVPCRGVIEGFYGNPWPHADRLRQFDFYGKYKLNCYVYGPKDDPYHRARWREPYPEEEARRISELVVAAHRNKVRFVWAIHPGGDIRWTRDDSIAIVNKLQKMYELGVRSFAVFFDDIEGEGAKATKQAALLNYITDEFVSKSEDVSPLIICPTDYNKSWAGKTYLPTLGKELYPDIRIMWTGSSVVDMIERDDLDWVNPRIARKAFIWLNYPVNDYCQSRLLMG
ncbi:MAG: beta-N-acetylglucosaminidase domain-containing protein, partial [Prevotellaceae bacterium]|nr:beta-N-acetylglucosaminidase domain-containing protein [Prevotellaceae bacterium]